MALRKIQSDMVSNLADLDFNTATLYSNLSVYGEIRTTNLNWLTAADVSVSSLTTRNNLQVSGNLTISGNLSALGTTTYLDTQVVVTSAMSISNTGTGPALIVNQTGPQPIAHFQDDGTTALFIADGGNVGVETNAPQTALHVVGDTTLWGSLSVRQTAIQDGVTLRGRDGGTGSFGVILTPTTLTADRILTLPNVNGTLITEDSSNNLVNKTYNGLSISTTTTTLANLGTNVTGTVNIGGDGVTVNVGSTVSNGTLNIRGNTGVTLGTNITTGTIDAFIGNNGTINLGGDTSTITVGNIFTVGRAGNGTLNINGSSTAGTATLATNITTGTVNIFNTGVTGIISIGGAATSLTIGTATAASAYNFAGGATINGATKAINIGTGGVAGSVTNITLGSTTGTSTITINGNLVTGNASSTADTDVTVDASTTLLYAYSQSASNTTRTINISNLIAGRKITLYLRNISGGSKQINIAASTTTSGFNLVNLANGNGAISSTSVTLAATAGTAVVTVFNANGIIGGGII